jgi:N-acyl-D-amino-acid deacylase
LNSVWVLFLLATAAFGQSQQDIRKAIDRALPPLQRSAAAFVEKRACFSCHHNALAIMTMRMARERGVRIDDAVLAAVEEKTWKSGGTLDDVEQARNVNDPTPNDSLLLIAQEFAGKEPDATAQVRMRRLASWQRPDGHWVTSDFRPPHSSSLFTATATAVRALRSGGNLAAARRWLIANVPVSTEDASFRLMGLVWAGAEQRDIGSARRDLLAMQKSDGGWGQLAWYKSDAYSTGEAVFALHESGVDAPKGIRFLLSKQAGDGTWRVRTRMVSPAEVSPPYFETGFPYKKDQFISYAGSSWATMALLTTIPAGAKVERPYPLYNGRVWEDVPLYTRLTVEASYYGNTTEVARLLRMGALPNAPEGTRSGNTPLRYAAMSGDLATVRLLLQSGADVNKNSPLSEAITFGHADVARELIAAGAETGGVDNTGVNLMHWATITNRSDVIPILVEAKVPLNDIDDNGFTPLMYAATIDFGDTKTLDALLAAGADVTIKDFKNRSPLQQARRLKHANIEAALRAKGAR